MIFFKLKEHNTTIKIELLAGLTSFFAAIYIVVVNANILSDGGVSVEPLIIATVFASFVGCLLASFISNTPLIIMPGMGINALFTYTLVLKLGLSFNAALTSVFLAGLLFFIITLTPLSDILTNSIPNSLKESITVGIGLFITFLGFQKGGLIVPDPITYVKLGDLSDINVLIFIITLIITLGLFLLNVPGGFLISIIIGTAISIFVGSVDISNIHLSIPSFTEYSSIFSKLDFNSILTIPFWIATFSLFLILLFENIGLLHGQVSGMLNAPHKTKKALSAVALSTATCGLLGTSPSVSTVEGTAGIAAGGRTGLTSLFTAFLILLSLFFIPVITIIPNAAISPILIVIGGLMLQHINNIDFKNLSEGFPAFMTLSLIPLSFSIIDGIALGFISYPLVKLFSKKEKDISITMYIIAFIFLGYFIVNNLTF